jgi:hypothetical protein
MSFDLIGEHVDIRCSNETVEVFFHGNRVASHIRRKKSQPDPIRIKEHMPPEHQKYLAYDPEEFLLWANSIGESTTQVVNYFLTSGKEPEQGYKYCVSLLKTADRYGQIRMEKACERLLTFLHSRPFGTSLQFLRTVRIRSRWIILWMIVLKMKNTAKELLVALHLSGMEVMQNVRYSHY